MNGIETGAQVNVGVEYTQAEKTKLAGITITLVQTTQAQYDAITTKDANTLYLITG